MGAYLLRRLLLVVPTLLGILIINFAVVQFAPGGPVEQMLAELRGEGQSTLGRITGEGVLIIKAQQYRTQEQNRADALARLAELIIAAGKTEKKRRPTKPTLGSKTRRLEGKARRSTVKAGRGKVDF